MSTAGITLTIDNVMGIILTVVKKETNKVIHSLQLELYNCGMRGFLSITESYFI